MSVVPGLKPGGSFMNVRFASEVHAGQAVIMGAPFDCGAHPTRIGSRQGPQAIRDQSALVRPYYPPLSDTNPLVDLDVVDLGDIDVANGDVARSFTAIETALAAVLDGGATPVTLGGDGAVSLPQMRAVARHFNDVVLVHIDAHTDTYALPGYNNATTFTRAVEERLIDVASSFHIGARGTLPMPGVYEYARGLGFNLITGADVARRGVADVLLEVQKRAAGRPVYLCFDMDYFDPSAAPGVATPTWGGPRAEEVFDLLHGLAGLNIVAVDVNTVSPPHDTAGMTASLAAHVVMIALHLIASNPVRRQRRENHGCESDATT